jgi:hypothetical protein
MEGSGLGLTKGNAGHLLEGLTKSTHKSPRQFERWIQHILNMGVNTQPQRSVYFVNCVSRLYSDYSC